jgi:hypothetical protein
MEPEQKQGANIMNLSDQRSDDKNLQKTNTDRRFLLSLLQHQSFASLRAPCYWYFLNPQKLTNHCHRRYIPATTLLCQASHYHLQPHCEVHLLKTENRTNFQFHFNRETKGKRKTKNTELFQQRKLNSIDTILQNMSAIQRVRQITRNGQGNKRGKNKNTELFPAKMLNSIDTILQDTMNTFLFHYIKKYFISIFSSDKDRMESCLVYLIATATTIIQTE